MDRIKNIRSYIFALFLVFVLSVFCGIKFFVVYADAADNMDTIILAEQQIMAANPGQSKKTDIDILKKAKKRSKRDIANRIRSSELALGVQRQGGLVALKKLPVDKDSKTNSKKIQVIESGSIVVPNSVKKIL